ncbi:hypothetical protein IPM62_00725 [Candidatus Woesebacteria bacterium]|nr:MAG: hypothetical protein IPM62_00725 [Candidatus Woesebacteria bacterium]
MNKLFDGCKVYFSNSIKGVPDIDPNFGYELVQFMKNNGADVLSEHVAGRNQKEIDKVFEQRVGIKWDEVENPWEMARKVDMAWVDEATHLVAIVNSPSLGVGMEIERAIGKAKRGLNKTYILCLVREDLLHNLSSMVRGITEEEAPEFNLVTYTNLDDAKQLIEKFLSNSASFK